MDLVYNYFQGRGTTLAAHSLVRIEECVWPQRIMKTTRATVRELVCLIMARTVKYVSILTLLNSFNSGIAKKDSHYLTYSYFH